MRLLVGLLFAIGAVLTFSVSTATALEVPAEPTLDSPIVDQTGTLTPDQMKQLADQIAASRKEKSYQIGILIVSSLGNDEYLEGYSLKVARQWGIGDKTSNGVLLLVVMDDRKLRIEVGRGLEGDLTDVRANRIIRNVITPQFKAGKYYEGVSAGVNSIQLAVAKQADPAAEKEPAQQIDWGSVLFAVLFFGIGALSWLGAILGRSKKWWAGGVIGGVAGIILALVFSFVLWSIFALVGLIIAGLLFDFVVSKNYKAHAADHTAAAWWAGGGWGGGSSGGGGFGGGGFSGGGSSGSW